MPLYNPTSSSTTVTPLTAIYTTTNSQTITTGTTKLIDFDTSVEDASSCVTTGASWHFTVPTGKAGLYLVHAHVTVTSGVSADIDFTPKLFKGGSLLIADAEQNIRQSAGAANTGVQGTFVVRLADADTIDFRVSSNSGANQSTITTAGFNRIAIVRLGS